MSKQPVLPPRPHVWLSDGLAKETIVCVSCGAKQTKKNRDAECPHKGM